MFDTSSTKRIRLALSVISDGKFVRQIQSLSQFLRNGSVVGIIERSRSISYASARA